MPWKECTCMSEREEFVRRALKQEGSFTALCGEFGVSRKKGYAVMDRFAKEGQAGLVERSRRPHTSPRHTG